ncbi:MAG: NAD(P)-dependent oxidoreductase [Promethearchaeota archaeon]|nr:MAG: NAD(P)-dependent oxidoreductase [Candidatus Lokiarchaeota archaeon]
MVIRDLNWALVDGALGHTGSFLVKRLIELDWKVVATDLEKEDREILMTKEKVFNQSSESLDCRNWENVIFIPTDLTKKKTLELLFSKDLINNKTQNYDVIFHPASLYDYGAPYELLHEINYVGLRNFLDVILNYADEENTTPPRFVHWSTCGVYGEPDYQTDKNGYIYPIGENAPYNPPNNYSQTKVEQEKLILKTAKKRPDFTYTILRPAPIYGPYQTYGMFHIFYTSYIMGHSVLSKVYPKNKKLMMPMVYIDDLIRAAIFLAEKDEAINEVYNVINDSPLQEHFLEFIYYELGTTFSVFPVPWFFFRVLCKILYYLAKRKEKKNKKLGIRSKFDLPMVQYLTHQYYFSNEKLKKLGFQFEYNNFQKGVYETIDWYKRHNWLPMDIKPTPDYINTIPKPPIIPKREYKTPMEGGETF